MNLAAFILAGGRSQRMGQDKALLTQNGTPLLRQTWDVAHTLTPQVWVVTPHRDRYESLLPAETHWIDESAPPSHQPPAGPLIAFARALANPKISADWVLLLACDLPNLQGAVLQTWRDELAQVPADAIAYLPHTNKGWEPLCGFYRRSCLSSLDHYCSSGKRSFQHWLDQETVQPIADVPVAMLANCNTPADWARLSSS